MATTRTQEEIDNAAAEIDAAEAAVAGNARKVRRAVKGNFLEDHVDEAIDDVVDMKATFDGLIADAQDALRDVQQPIRRFVQEHPLASLAAVAGVAMLLLRRPR